ncbi:CsgG/HfaB family protein [Minwuia thermotolerans]|uniref:Curli production assembly/transport component CsgG n=1 Tax=Minwuia thermotolerans TaxID=2056226 RepID=A0A2M9G0M7_9PROT|nr:CsgG/HfaB family protein [Minwuia thermotolerans]PJK29271.1 curli production assembly/transport component CsgG [Minwuia thermotolerans]
MRNNKQNKRSRRLGQVSTIAAAALIAAACEGHIEHGEDGVDPVFSFPVTSNETPYTQCLAGLSRQNGDNLPIFAVGEVADKSGQIDLQTGSRALSQGVSEMVISALGRTGKVRMVERLDLRIPLAEMKLAQGGQLERDIDDYELPASDFIVAGALTELNHNIASGGVRASVKGVGGSARSVVINVALDLRVINSRNFTVPYTLSLQKQIYGYEVQANIFRFFGDHLVEFDAGQIENEPLQLGVRSVVEMAVYRVMTDFLGLEPDAQCRLVRTDHMGEEL